MSTRLSNVSRKALLPTHQLEIAKNKTMANIDGKVINYVCEYEIIYTIGHQHYYDNIKKDDAWEELARLIEMQGK